MNDSLHCIVRCLESVAFVALMALCCFGSLIVCLCWCFLLSGGKEMRGRYWVGMQDN